MTELKCAFDKDRVCDETCAAADMDSPGFDSAPYWDESDPVPQFKWKRTVHYKGTFCFRLERHIGKKEVIEDRT